MIEFKDKKVVLLNTDETPTEGTVLFRSVFGDKSLWQYKDTFDYKCGTKVYRTLNGTFEDWYKAFVPQHLYVVSNDEIKEGDWAIADYVTGFTDLDGKPCNEGELYLVQVKGVVLGNVEHGQELLFHYGGFTHELRFCKKIVETTNTSLTKEDNSNTDADDAQWARIPLKLPQPSQEFIKEFIESYNKENKLPFKLVRNNYSKEEVRIKLKASFYKGVEAESGQLDLDFNIDKWIEENL